MHSKNKRSPDSEERDYIRLVKLCQCSVCDVGGGYGAPSEAHELKQGQWWTAVALCADCHRGPHNGVVGSVEAIGRGIWAVKKMSQLDALAVTIRRVYQLLKEELSGHRQQARVVSLP